MQARHVLMDEIVSGIVLSLSPRIFSWNFSRLHNYISNTRDELKKKLCFITKEMYYNYNINSLETRNGIKLAVIPHDCIITRIWAHFLSNICMCFVLYIVRITNVTHTYTLLYLPNLMGCLFSCCVVYITIIFITVQQSTQRWVAM